MPEETDATETPAATEQPSGLEALLVDLPDEARSAVMSEVKRARQDAAKYRTQAQRYGDLDPEVARQAVEKLAEAEAANKSEAEKAAERAAKAEQERDTLRTELLRYRIGSKHGLSETLTNLLQGTDEETMNAHAQAIADELASVRQRPGDAVPNTTKPAGSPGAATADVFDPKQIAAESLRGL